MVQEVFGKHMIFLYLTIAIVGAFAEAALYYPNYFLFFYFMGIISYTFGAYFMHKEINFEKLAIPVILIRFFQILIPSTGLIRVGLLFLIK